MKFKVGSTHILKSNFHSIASGLIPLSSKSLEKLQISRKTAFLNRTFKLQSKVRILLQSPRPEKINILLKLHKHFNNMLESLFVPRKDYRTHIKQSNIVPESSDNPEAIENDFGGLIE